MNSKIRVDYLKGHRDYLVCQHKEMYHFNTDTCLLGDYIKVDRNKTYLDVGTNNGALLVYILKKGAKATGIDINRKALKIARKTLKINKLKAKLKCVDFNKLNQRFKYDVIVSNPPYFNTSDDNKSLNKNKAIARHEGTLTLSSLCKGIANHLKYDGSCYLVYRPSRLKELEKQLNANGLYINDLVYAYDKSNENNPKTILLNVTFKKTSYNVNNIVIGETYAKEL